MRTWIRVDPRRLAYILGIPRMPRWERGIGSPFWFTHLPPTRHRPQNHEPQRFDSVIEESEDTQKDRQNSKEDENHRNRVRGQRDITGLVSRLESVSVSVCVCRSVCDKRRSVCNRIELHYNLLRDAK